MALEPAPAFVWGAGGAQMTPDQIAAQRKVAQAMMAQGMGYSPIQSPWQGAARVAQAMMGGLEAGQADAAAKANQKAESDLLSSIFGGGATPTAATATTPAGLNGAIAKVAAAVPNDSNAVPGTVGMKQRLADLSQDFIDDNPGTYLSSGVRSTADQARLYADRANNPNPVAVPGTSRHETGNAVDIGGMTPEQRAMLPQYGLAQPVANDPPHVELAAPNAPVQVASADPGFVPSASAGAPGAQMAQAAPATPQAAPGVNPALLRAMSSPYVSDGTKKILGLVLSQQMEAAKNAADPLRQLQMQKLQAEIGKVGTTAPTVQRVKQPDGSEVAVQWDAASSSWVPLKAPEGGNPVGSPKLTEQQSKDVGFYNRGRKLLPRLEQQDQALTDLASTAGGSISNYFKTDKFRQAEQTGRELLAVILRKDTGAAVTPQEFTMYSDIYLPRPGDDTATVIQKRAARATAIEGLKMGLGPAEIIFRSREAAEAAKAAATLSSAPSPSGQTPEGATAINPKTGETIILRNGKWVPLS